MAHFDDYREGLPRHYGLYWAEVTDVADPLNRRRVRFRIDGLIEPQSDWAYLVLPGAGAPRRGLRITPKVGSTVLVGFAQGLTEAPFVLGGITVPDSTEITSDIANTETPDVCELAMGRYSLIIEDNATTPRLYIRDEGAVDPNDPNHTDPCYLYFDGATRTVTIRGQVTVNITSDGVVNVDAGRVQIQDRPVQDNGAPI